MPVRDSYAHGEFCWVDLNSHDMEGAKAFYQGLFGWEAVDFDTQGGPPYAGWMRDGKNVGGLGQMSDEMKAQGIPSMWNSYMKVDDAAALEKKALDLGATVAFPTMQVMESGHMNFITDPTGATFASWQPLSHHGCEVWGEDNSPCWCELATRDADGAKTFYEQLVGWTCNAFDGTPTKYYVANVNETTMTGGILEMNEQWGDVPPHWSVYFHVDDVDAACSRCDSLGGKVCFPAFNAGVGRIAGCMDPQGAFFYLIKLAPPAEQG